MARYLLTDVAKEDVRGIVDFIRERSPDAAKRVRAELRRAMRRLPEFFGMGHLRTDLADEPVRFWCIYSYLIVYRDNRKPIEIIRVLHGARDVQALLRDS